MDQVRIQLEVGVYKIQKMTVNELLKIVWSVIENWANKVDFRHRKFWTLSQEIQMRKKLLKYLLIHVCLIMLNFSSMFQVIKEMARILAYRATYTIQMCGLLHGVTKLVIVIMDTYALRKFWTWTH